METCDRSALLDRATSFRAGDMLWHVGCNVDGTRSGRRQARIRAVRVLMQRGRVRFDSVETSVGAKRRIHCNAPRCTGHSKARPRAAGSGMAQGGHAPADAARNLDATGRGELRQARELTHLPDARHRRGEGECGGGPGKSAPVIGSEPRSIGVVCSGPVVGPPGGVG